jgi:hypothetical protein
MKAWGWLAGLVVLVCGLVSRAQDNPAKALPADLARVPSKAVFVLSVRPADLWNGELGKGMRAGLGKMEEAVSTGIGGEVGLPPAELERLTVVVTETLNVAPLFFARTTKKFQKDKLLNRVVPDSRAVKRGDGEYHVSGRRAVVILGDQEYVASSEPTIQSYLDSKPGKEKALAATLALAARKHSLVVGINPREIPVPGGQLPPQAAPFKPLFKATEGTIAVDLGTKTTGQLKVAFETEDDAREGVKAVEAARKLGEGMLAATVKQLGGEKDAEAAAFAKLLGQVQEAVKKATLKRDGMAVTGSLQLKVDGEQAAKVTGAMARKVRIAAMRTQSVNNLKQLALAMHGYHDREKTFPPRAVFDKNGKALLSWRVLLLPYLGHDQLYKEFKLDEPWDSKHNKKLLAKMPRVYEAPAGMGKAGHTYYLGLAGKDCFFDGKKGISFVDITDGTSNTLMIVEGGKAVPWTKPEDVEYDAMKPVPKLGGLFQEGFAGALADGSVRFFVRSVKESTLRLYITRNDGKVIPADD